MAEEEQEYYWDEDSQTYYYWDEETQGYYPWEEEEEESAAAAPQVETPTVIIPEAPQGVEHYQRGGTRGFTRHLSLAEHGGLEGCLQIINEERKQRAGTSEYCRRWTSFMFCLQ